MVTFNTRILGSSAKAAPFAAQQSPSVDPTRNMSFAELDQFFLRLLQGAFLPSNQSVELASAAAADAIDDKMPVEDGIGDKCPENYLWRLWTTMLMTVWKLPDGADPRRQDILVGIIGNLQRRDKGVVTVWGSPASLWQDLPLFTQRMTDTGGSPARPGAAPPAEEDVRMWRNQSGFCARLLTAGVAS
ncbi:hypothetical protein SEUCBS140593_006683 [Sporothrix eucalyptigena]|uniref:Uncharacterized protein n=1 Tax=Sporothrix eucalyptigena TaxID=1812306 RepID=A0ABP0C6X1_9PEZI